MKNPYFYAFGAVFFWATVATAFKLALRSINFFQLLFYSVLFSTICLFIILIAQGKWSKLCQVNRQQFLQSSYLGLLNPFGYYLILFKAYSLLPAQQAQPLNYTWPLVLVIFSALFHKERITSKNLSGIVVSFFGVIVIATQGRFSALSIEEPTGVFLAVISSVLWAAYWLANVRDSLDVMVRMFLNFFFGFFYIFLASLWFDYTLVLPMVPLAFCLYIGLFEMGVTFVLWSRALQLSQGTLVSHLVYLSPFISLVFIQLVLKEDIKAASVMGLLFIIAGIFIGKGQNQSESSAA